MTKDHDNGPPSGHEPQSSPAQRSDSKPPESGSPVLDDDTFDTPEPGYADSADDGGEFTNCLRFIENVRRESPHCLTGLGSGYRSDSDADDRERVVIVDAGDADLHAARDLLPLGDRVVGHVVGKSADVVIESSPNDHKRLVQFRRFSDPSGRYNAPDPMATRER